VPYELPSISDSSTKHGEPAAISLDSADASWSNGCSSGLLRQRREAGSSRVAWLSKCVSLTVPAERRTST
jgi:hypothetical protein